MGQDPGSSGHGHPQAPGGSPRSPKGAGEAQTVAVDSASSPGPLRTQESRHAHPGEQVKDGDWLPGDSGPQTSGRTSFRCSRATDGSGETDELSVSVPGSAGRQVPVFSLSPRNDLTWTGHRGGPWKEMQNSGNRKPWTMPSTQRIHSKGGCKVFRELPWDQSPADLTCGHTCQTPPRVSVMLQLVTS